MTLTITISEPGAKRLFDQSVAGYQRANADLDSAIENENWGAINRAQESRDLHASTIALIVYSATAEQGGRP